MRRRPARSRAVGAPRIDAPISVFTRRCSSSGLSRIVQASLYAERFSFDIDEQALAAVDRLDGKLLLVTSLEQLDAEAIVTRYRSLADIERGFRAMKSTLEIAPVYHRLPDRIRAHALICFLALLPYRVLRLRLQANNAAAPTAWNVPWRRWRASSCTDLSLKGKP